MLFPLSKADLESRPDDGNSQDKGPPDLLWEEVNMQHMITAEIMTSLERYIMFILSDAEQRLIVAGPALLFLCLCEEEIMST